MLGAHRRPLLQVRLGKRVRALGLASFSAYHRLLMERDPDGAEMNRLVNAITTNKTEFLREPHHFSYLRDVWAPPLRARLAGGESPRVRLWSAGCSTGEEPYTIAFTVLEALGSGSLDLRILASDIATDVLARAAAGVYPLDDLAAIPRATLARYFLKGTGANAGLARVHPELASVVTFREINLLDAVWPIRTRFDVIFCRNVLIYFDRPTQRRVVEHLLDYVTDDGLLVLGHSESVAGLVDGLRHAGTTIYQRDKESDI